MSPRYPGDGSPQLSREQLFFRSDPHVVGSGDFVGFGPVLGLGHLEKFRAWAENRKTNFPGAEGPETEKKSYHAIRDGCPQLFYSLRFGRQDPHGREIAKYGHLRPFWPRTVLGTWRNPGAGPKTEKCDFPVPGALLRGESGRPQKFLPESAQLLYALSFGRLDPHG